VRDVGRVLAKRLAVIAERRRTRPDRRASARAARAQPAERVVGHVHVVGVRVGVARLGNGRGATPGAWYGWWPAIGMNTAKKRWPAGSASTNASSASAVARSSTPKLDAVRAGDAARVAQLLESAPLHHRAHAEVDEPAE
jgi:hypothetical protein